ncbi:MAG: MFS transporter [Candidatus Rokubacteria bacterium]|nr:MFS transporter [Candidatus Rokubacteria bacterium]
MSVLVHATVRRRAGESVMPAAMFLGSFAWSFVFISLPFHIHRISTYDPATTLRWTGWIIGVSSLATVATAPVWGHWAERGNPRRLYVIVQMLQGVSFLGVAVARTLPELFLARLILGVMGASSTFAFMLSGRADDPKRVTREIAAVQSAMTIGQVIGPLVGAIAAARVGFRVSFVLGGLVLFGCAALVEWGMPVVRPARPGGRRGQQVGPGEVAAVGLLVLGASTQVFFLTSILPQVLPPLGIADAQAVEMGGVLMFVSSAGAALGALATPRLLELGSPRRIVPALLVGSSLCLALLALVTSFWLYGLLRFLQVLSIAPVFPLAVTRIVQRAGGQVIGLINSARIGASFIGPVMATSVLSWSTPGVLYALLAAIGVACVPMARARVAVASRSVA